MVSLIPAYACSNRSNFVFLHLKDKSESHVFQDVHNIALLFVSSVRNVGSFYSGRRQIVASAFTRARFVS